MVRESKVKQKSYAFALLVIDAARMLQQRKEYVLSNQLLRSGTSIGANVEEANAAQTKRDFIAKMAIASKEARESDYWLRLLSDAGYLDKGSADELRSMCLELIKMLTAIVKTSQLNTKHGSLTIKP